VLYCVIVLHCDVLRYCFEFLCYCIVCIVGDCDKFHIQQSVTDIGSMECVYVNVNVNVKRQSLSPSSTRTQAVQHVALLVR
jgi:hypothetical protein